MDNETQNIIREILTKLNLCWNEPDNSPTSYRFRLCHSAFKQPKYSNVYFNIPKNKKFVFQILFERENTNSRIVFELAENLEENNNGSYDICGGENYATIYLTKKNVADHLEINEDNAIAISNRIKTQIETVIIAILNIN